MIICATCVGKLKRKPNIFRWTGHDSIRLCNLVYGGLKWLYIVPSHGNLPNWYKLSLKNVLNVVWKDNFILIGLMPNHVVLVLPKLIQCKAGILYHVLGQKCDHSQYNLHLLLWTSRIQQKLLYHQLQITKNLHIKCKKIPTLDITWRCIILFTKLTSGSKFIKMFSNRPAWNVKKKTIHLLEYVKCQRNITALPRIANLRAF